MAVAAFKSTTKRNCTINPYNINGAGVQMQSLSPSQRRIHRRSRSFTDFGHAKYANDSQSPRESRTSNASNGPRSVRFLARQFSESDASIARRKQDANEIDDVRDQMPHHVNGLQLLSNQLDVLKNSEELHGLASPKRPMKVFPNERQIGDQSEGQAEEKIIRAVHAQIKPFWADSFSKELTAGNLYNRIRAEVWQAVAEIRDDLQQSLGKTCSLDSPTFKLGDKSTISFHDDIMQAATDICKEYAAKLDESEKKVEKLQTQLALEEQQCLDLVQLIKGLLPGSSLLPEISSTNTDERRVSMQKYLNESAGRMEECVSASLLDSSEGQTASKEEFSSSLESRIAACGICPSTGRSMWLKESGHENCTSADKKADQRAVSKDQGGNCQHMKLDSASQVRRSEEFRSITRPVSKDGVILPWLQWEVNAEIFPKKVSGSSNAQVDAHWTTTSNKCSSMLFEHKAERNTGRRTSYTTLESFQSKSIISEPFQAEVKMSSSNRVLKCIKKRRSSFLETEEMIMERIQFKSRIDSGQLLLCTGGLQIF